VLKTEERTIGETRYRISQLGFGRGRATLVRLGHVLGPVVAELVGAAGGLDGGAAAAAAVKELAARMTDADLEYFCETFAAATEVQVADGKWVPLRGVMEVQFAGRYDEMFRWLAACAEVNYSSFFAGLLTAAARGVPPPATT
jgi:tail assembly chaperone